MTAKILELPKRTEDKNADLDHLIHCLENAKAMEKAGKDMRLTVEQEIIEIMGCKDEGAYTYKTNEFKNTTTGKLNRKINWAEFDKISDLIQEDNRPVIYKRELDVKKLKELEKTSPDDYTLITKVMTTTPYKPSVSFKYVDEGK